MKRLAYVYFNDIAKPAANVNQALNMAAAFSKETETFFLSSWVSRNALKKRLRFFSVDGGFGHVRIPIVLISSVAIFEMITRIIYCVLTLAWLKMNRMDIIYTRDFGFIYFLSRIPSFMRPKEMIVYEPHTIYHLSSSKVRLEQEQRALTVPDFFVPISNGIRKDLVDIFHVPETKIEVFPDAYNSAVFAKIQPDDGFLSRRFPGTSGKRTILYMGSFKKWKGVDFLVKSIPHFGNTEYVFLLIGAIGTARTEIEGLARSLGVEDRVILGGFLSQEEVVSVLKSVDVAVIPNSMSTIGKHYTSPLKCYEYMAAGLPIVASDLPSLREILKEGKNCLFFTPENHTELAARLAQLTDDDRLAERIGANNLELSKDSTWRNRAKGILETLTHFERAVAQGQGKNFFIKSGYRNNPVNLTLADVSKTPYWTADRIKTSRDYQYPVYLFAADIMASRNLKEIMDVGCGSGAKLAMIKRRVPDVRIIGVDQPEAIEYCRSTHDFGEWHAENLEVPSPANAMKAELILCADVIEHLLNPDIMLENIKARLVPGGYVIISTPERDALLGERASKPSIAQHVREWNFNEFSAYMQDRGFDILEHFTQPPVRFTFSRCSIRCLLPRVLMLRPLKTNQVCLMQLKGNSQLADRQ